MGRTKTSKKKIPGAAKKPAPVRLSSKHRDEIVAIAKNLPFQDIPIPEFSDRNWQPVSVRQPRTYTRPDSGMQAIGRFLIERGMVDLLRPEDTQHLFEEIHWGIHRIMKLSRQRFRSPHDARQALREVHALISRIEAAEEELFIANRRLVARCVRPYFWIGQIWLADFLQEGSKALSNAIRKFDFTRGTPFFAYAQRAIQNRLRNYFRDHIRMGNLGMQPSREMVLIRTTMEEWKSMHGGEPPAQTLSNLTEIPVERVEKLLPLILQWIRVPQQPLSLDERMGESQADLHQFIEDESLDSAETLAQRSEVWKAVEQLTPRSKEIMHLRFFEGFTLQEAGDKLGLTRARIKQIQDEALKKLRHILKQGGKQP